MTSLSSPKAFFIAGNNSLSHRTLVIPKLEPPKLGLTKQGYPILFRTSSKSKEGTSFSFNINDSATVIPKHFRYCAQTNLLYVIEAANTPQVE